jgi:hypothetical protein
MQISLSPIGRSARLAGWLMPALVIAGLLAAVPASALPSFAQQTGAGCAQCHTASYGPALTQFGREFKLQGYAIGGGSSIPLDAMVNFNFTNTGEGIPGGAAPHYNDNNNLAFSEVAGFFAGRITDHFGGLAQVTYSGVDGAAAWDNLDLRFADTSSLGGHSLVWGLTLNNNPTIQDLWNSTPGWGFPYTASDLAPTPTAAPLIDGGLAQQVLGLTALAQVDGWLYVEFGGYENLSNSALDNLGISDAKTMDHVNGFAPYWRVAVEHEFAPSYVSAGLFGLSADLYPGDDHSEGTNRYTDLGYDATYEYSAGGLSTWDVYASYIHESQDLRASRALGDSSGRNESLNEAKLNVQYGYDQSYIFTGGLFGISGSRNAVMYGSDPVDGSANGSPNSQGYVLEADWIPWGKLTSPYQPWMNARVGIQYTGYWKFNGGDTNYDGYGRSAADNNTIFLFLWVTI